MSTIFINMVLVTKMFAETGGRLFLDLINSLQSIFLIRSIKLRSVTHDMSLASYIYLMITKGETYDDDRSEQFRKRISKF